MSKSSTDQHVALAIAIVLICAATCALRSPPLQRDPRWRDAAGPLLERQLNQREEWANQIRAMESQFLERRDLTEAEQEVVRTNVQNALRTFQLVFDGCHGTDLALRRLDASIQRPSSICLMECDVSDRGMGNLVDQPNLRHMWILDCPRVTARGVRRLSDQLGIGIHFKSADSQHLVLVE